jgi:heterodisulfide reductase subunit A
MREALRVGVFVCDCGSNIAGMVDTEAVREYAAALPNVVLAVRNKYTCADPGQQEIQRSIYENNLNRVVVASCSPTSYEAIFRACIQGAGLNRYLLEMANIREHCSWVTTDSEAATQKAKEIVKVAVARAKWLYPQDEEHIPVTDAALVIGGGVAGIQASLDIADAGHKVYLVEKKPSIGGIMAQLDKVYPDIECSI